MRFIAKTISIIISIGFFPFSAVFFILFDFCSCYVFRSYHMKLQLLNYVCCTLQSSAASIETVDHWRQNAALSCSFGCYLIIFWIDFRTWTEFSVSFILCVVCFVFCLFNFKYVHFAEWHTHNELSKEDAKIFDFLINYSHRRNGKGVKIVFCWNISYVQCLKMEITST